MKENMSITHSINKEWFESFLREGAFLKRSDGQMYLWSGPWKNSIKSDSYNVSLQNFFSSHALKFYSQNEVLQISADELQKLLFQYFPNSTGEISTKDFSTAHKESFFENFQTIQGKIQRQEIEKAVPCSLIRTEKKPTYSDKVCWIKKLIQTSSELFSYGFWSKENGVMGATPETLFERDGHVIQSMALAGTLFRSNEATAQQLLKSEKDRHEHQVVVDDIENQLSRLGWVKKGDLQVIELPTLFHLKTTFESEIGMKTDEELIQHLHPTPALGVHPRAFGFHWMEQLLEQKDRDLHGSPLLFQYGKKKSTCLVAIRNIQWGNYGAKIIAGCGIVKESQLESEWNEIKNKIDSVLQLLGMK